MRNHAAVLLVLVPFVFASAAFAQCPATPPPGSCPTMPGDSPVLAPALDTVPPGCALRMTYSPYPNTYVPGKANAGLAMAQVNENEQQVWFSVDANPSDRHTYYNRRYRANASSPWYWQYSMSVPIIDYGSGTASGANIVLYSATPKYRDTVTGIDYRYLMYGVGQPQPCNGAVAGYLFVSFSNDGLCWTALRRGVRLGGPNSKCGEAASNTVPVETMSAIDAGSTIYLVGIEGDIGLLSDYQQMDRSQTYLGTALPSSPHLVTLVGSGELSNAGIVNPTGDPRPYGYTERYRSYSYFINMDMAYDAATGYFYMGRGYPFPFDRWGKIVPPAQQTTPCSWQKDAGYMWDWQNSRSVLIQGCGAPPATLPNRIQIYRMYIGALSNIGAILTGTWTLVSDLGGDVGYTNSFLASCDTYAAYTQRSDARQQNAGHDFAYIKFVRDATGLLTPSGAFGSILAGDSFLLSKGYGYCRVTGDEKIYLLNFPR